MYVWRNIEARWKRNKYYMFLCACASERVAWIIEHASRRCIVICGLSGSTIFLDIIS
jgi:hypothetical protein